MSREQRAESSSEQSEAATRFPEKQKQEAAATLLSSFFTYSSGGGGRYYVHLTEGAQYERSTIRSLRLSSQILWSYYLLRELPECLIPHHSVVAPLATRNSSNRETLRGFGAILIRTLFLSRFQAMADEDRMHDDIADMMYGFGDSEW